MKESCLLDCFQAHKQFCILAHLLGGKHHLRGSRPTYTIQQLRKCLTDTLIGQSNEGSSPVGIPCSQVYLCLFQIDKTEPVPLPICRCFPSLTWKLVSPYWKFLKIFLTSASITSKNESKISFLFCHFQNIWDKGRLSFIWKYRGAWAGVRSGSQFLPESSALLG